MHDKYRPWQQALDENPGLHFHPHRQEVRGTISFECCYEPNVGFQYLIEESSYLRHSPHFIADEHNIAISLNADDATRGLGGHPPTRLLDNDRVDRILKQQNLASKSDLHINDDNSCCLMLGEPAIANLPLHEFIPAAVLPWLYRLSYVERFGLAAAQENLWDEYSHYQDGAQEWLSEHAGMGAKARAMKGICPCGSQRPFKRCHGPIFKKVARQAAAKP